MVSVANKAVVSKAGLTDKKGGTCAFITKSVIRFYIFKKGCFIGGQWQLVWRLLAHN